LPAASAAAAAAEGEGFLAIAARVWRVSEMEELLSVASKGLYCGFGLMGQNGPPKGFPLLILKQPFVIFLIWILLREVAKSLNSEKSKNKKYCERNSVVGLAISKLFGKNNGSARF
jgi:hypothetical protein